MWNSHETTMHGGTAVHCMKVEIRPGVFCQNITKILRSKRDWKAIGQEKKVRYIFAVLRVMSCFRDR